MHITYHGHSGFSVRTKEHLLIFDYLGEGLTRPEKSDRAIAFVSHAHRDHFHPSVVRWAEEEYACLVTGDDVEAGGVRLSPGDRTELDGVKIEAFGSTDQGVSFLAQADGESIFHAGDLNFWHWRHESTEEEIREAEEAFERVLMTLKGRRMDAAFFPADPRMGEGYEEGAVRFAEALRPGCLIPMHFWNRPEAALMMKEKPMPEGVRLIVLTQPGESVSTGTDIDEQERSGQNEIHL